MHTSKISYNIIIYTLKNIIIVKVNMIQHFEQIFIPVLRFWFVLDSSVLTQHHCDALMIVRPILFNIALSY
jgi:hypothetical protein